MPTCVYSHPEIDLHVYVFPEQDAMKKYKPKKLRKYYQSDHSSLSFKMTFQI